jgi:hypothetical protein
MRKMTAKSPSVTDLEQRLSRASQPLGQLFSAVEQADAAPMPAVMEAWKAASAAVTSALAEWEKVRTSK